MEEDYLESAIKIARTPLPISPSTTSYNLQDLSDPLGGESMRPSSCPTVSLLTPRAGSHSHEPNKSSSFREIARDLTRKQCSQKEATKKLLSYFTRPQGEKLVSELLETLYRKKQFGDFQRIFTALFCSCVAPEWEGLEHRSVQFIYDFIRNQQFSTRELAGMIVEELFAQRICEELIVEIFSRYARKDMEIYPNPILAIRSGTFSSDLHVKYCTPLLRSNLFSLKIILKQYWNQNDPAMLSLFHAEVESEPSVKAAIQQNCRSLFFELIDQLYISPVHPTCHRLLKNWRQEIYRHYCKTLPPEEAHLQSETQGEILFLKIINPYLMNLSKERYKRDLLLHVAKLIQALSNQFPCVEQLEEGAAIEQLGHLDPILNPFKDVYDYFLPIHRSYINTFF